MTTVPTPTKLCWILDAPVLVGPEGETSPLASARYRALIPARALADLGVASRTLRLDGDAADRLAGVWDGAPPDAVVVSKCFRAEGLAVAERARALGVRVLVDFCDNHFGHPALGPLMRRLVALADGVVASTPEMARIVGQETGARAHLAVDPYEGPAGEARFAPADGPLRLLWYGHPSNLGSLLQSVPDLASFAARRPIDLEVVSTVPEEIATRLVRLCAISGGRIRPVLTPWTPEAVWAGLAACDAVVIPIVPDAQTVVKSPNRLVEAIRAGRLTVAQPLPSYLPLADGAFVVGRLSEGLRQAVADPAATEARIRVGQGRVEAHHAPAVAARQWAEALAAVLSAGATAGGATVATDAPLRLNLGCGDKILPGYVNCDALAARGQGGSVDVQCDVTKALPFRDGSVDEILAVHVVEHLWRWEVPDILREWGRVLRPGGRIVLECPNLLTACAELLRDPDRATGPGREGQRTMWVLYGDPGWRDPLMTHRWGYTPRSLGALLAEAGFVRVRQEPAQFKLREPRDMRIVGERADG